MDIPIRGSRRQPARPGERPRGSVACGLPCCLCYRQVGRARARALSCVCVYVPGNKFPLCHAVFRAAPTAAAGVPAGRCFRFEGAHKLRPVCRHRCNAMNCASQAPLWQGSPPAVRCRSPGPLRPRAVDQLGNSEARKLGRMGREGGGRREEGEGGGEDLAPSQRASSCLNFEAGQGGLGQGAGRARAAE